MGIIAAAVVVLGSGTVAAFLLIPAPVAPQEATTEATTLLTKMLHSKGKEFDEAKATKYLCPSYLTERRKWRNGFLADAAKHPNPNDPYWDDLPKINYKSTNIQVNGTSGTFDFLRFFQGKKVATTKMELTKQSGQWQVCGPILPQRPQ